jgi:hypothetical protein
LSCLMVGLAKLCNGAWSPAIGGSIHYNKDAESC